MTRLSWALLAALLAAPAFAQDATLTRISGPVFILPEGRVGYLEAKGGEELLFGDAIRVRKGGTAHVTMKDGGAVLLREETLMTLLGTTRRKILAVKFGEFLVGLKRRLKAGESFKVRTPAAVAAVRGTLFWGKSDRADQSSAYAGFGHAVAVRAQGKTVVVDPGMTVTVAFGAAPADPIESAVGLDYTKNFMIGGSLQGVEALAETDKLKP